MSRFLSEPEAWRAFAKRASVFDGTNHRLLDTSARALRVTWATWSRMYDRVEAHRDPGGKAFDRYAPDAADNAVVASLFLALEAEDEAASSQGGR